MQATQQRQSVVFRLIYLDCVCLLKFMNLEIISAIEINVAKWQTMFSITLAML